MIVPPAPEPLVEIVTTVANPQDAARIVRALVESRRVACGSWTSVRSVYIWNGETIEEDETKVELKTTAAGADAAEAALRVLHPYEVPAILRLAVLRADAAYAEWVRAAVLPADATP